MYADTRYLFLLIRFKQLSLFFNTPFLRRKRMQKYNLFQNYQNIFSKKMQMGRKSQKKDYNRAKTAKT